ncbi:gamma-glutamyl-gamma-aminobutyrate hydrolase family protein [Dysosmobacter sp.]
MMKKPVIGVMPLWDDRLESLWMLPGYLDGLRQAGALPVILPLETEEADIRQLYGLCDGLLFTGGHDVDPALYGAAPLPECGPPCRRRDALEASLFRLALEAGTPVLGICRGLQLINALLGGTLYQDLPTQRPGSVSHVMRPPYDRVIHPVALEAGGTLHRLTGQAALGVNSYHHQGIRTLAPALRADACAPDGLIEAVTCPEHPFLLAVQWHPEFSFRRDGASQAIFRAFVQSCQ